MRITFYIILFFLSSCSVLRSEFIYYENKPPNGILISNFYFDETEVSNFNWVEYMYWHSKVFGDSSIQHKSTIPNQNVWIDFNECLIDLKENYLLHPAYRDYPVVGITQKQAEDFSKWRSDRVMEFNLIREGVIVHDENQDSLSYFSMEKYFTGKYKNLKPDSSFKYIPEFRLPNLDELKEVKMFYRKDSMNLEIHCKGIHKVACDSNLTMDFTKPILIKDLNINHLFGNVSEFTAIENISFGGSWRDSIEFLIKKDTFQVLKPNAWTGFRNICEWKEWEKSIYYPHSK